MKFMVNFSNEGWNRFVNNGLPYVEDKEIVNVVNNGTCEIEADSVYDLIDYLDSCSVYTDQYEYEES